MLAVPFEITSMPEFWSGEQPLQNNQASPFTAQITMIKASDLAQALGYESITSAFRQFCHNAGIEPLPGRRDCYDPVAVRFRLDRIQGLVEGQSSSQSALEKSRSRRHA